MRIHSDKLTPELIRKCISEDPRFDGTGAAIWKLDEHGSRSRARAFEVRIGADAGQDVHGRTRRPSMGAGFNSPRHYDADFTEKALTYAEWGFFLANLYELDPDAKIGGYDGRADFVKQTFGNGYIGPAERSCRKYNDSEPWEACNWAFYYTPDDAPVGV